MPKRSLSLLAHNFFRVQEPKLPGFDVFLELCLVQLWLVGSYNLIRLFWRTYKPQLTNSSSLDLPSPFPFFAETHLILLFPMSSDENSPIGQKRPGALQLGPRKKPYVKYLLRRRSDSDFEDQLYDRPARTSWTALWAHRPCFMQRHCPSKQWFTVYRWAFGATGRNLHTWVCPAHFNLDVRLIYLPGNDKNIKSSSFCSKWYRG